MALDSFYGGKQGLSSVIRKSFKYISIHDPAYKVLSPEEQATAKENNEVMDECFADKDYTDVWYEELCLIDTPNKNNPANGCIFRRKYNRQYDWYPYWVQYDNTSGAVENANATLNNNANTRLYGEFVGQIVGPQSGTPFMSIGNLASVDNAAAQSYGPYSHTVYEVKDPNSSKAKRVLDTKLTNNNLNKIDTYAHNAGYTNIGENIFIQGSPTPGNTANGVDNDTI